MTDARQLERLLDAMRGLVDSRREEKAGGGTLRIYTTPYEMKELRSAFEPFRERSSSPRRSGQQWPFSPSTPEQDRR